MALLGILIALACWFLVFKLMIGRKYQKWQSHVFGAIVFIFVLITYIFLTISADDSFTKKTEVIEFHHTKDTELQVWNYDNRHEYGDNETIGSWLHTGDVQYKVYIYRQAVDGKLYLSQEYDPKFKDQNSPERLTEKMIDGQTRYLGGNYESLGEYYTISQKGDLLLWTKTGTYKTMPKI